MRTIPGNVDEVTLLSEGKKYALVLDSLSKQTKMISLSAHNVHDNFPLELHTLQNPIVEKKERNSRSKLTRQSYHRNQKANMGHHSVVVSSRNERNKTSTTNTFRTVLSNPQVEAKIVPTRSQCDATKNDHVDTKLNDNISMTTKTTTTTMTANDETEKYKQINGDAEQKGLVTGWFKTKCRNIFPTLDISRSKSTNTKNTMPPIVDGSREDSKLISEQSTDKANGHPETVVNNNQQSIIEQLSSISDYERRLLDDEPSGHFLATAENASQEKEAKTTRNQTSSRHQPINPPESRDPVEYKSSHDNSDREDYGDRYHHTDATNGEERGSTEEAVMTMSNNFNGIATATRTTSNSANTRDRHRIMYPSESRNPVEYTSSHDNSYRDDYEDRYHTDVTNSEERDLNAKNMKLVKATSGFHDPVAVATATGFKSINMPNLSNTAVAGDELVSLSNSDDPHSRSSITNGDYSCIDRNSSESNNNCKSKTDRYATEEESREEESIESKLKTSSDKYAELIMNSSSIESDYKSENSRGATGVYVISNLTTENGILSPCTSIDEKFNSGSSSRSSQSSPASSYDEETKFTSHCSSQSYDETTFMSSNYHSISRTSTLDSATAYTINRECDEEAHILWCFR